MTDRLAAMEPKHIPKRDQFKMTPEAFADIVNSVGTERCESGGILLGSRVDFVVRKYVHDPYGTRSGGAYDPDVDFLNRVVEQAWEEDGLAFLGFVHSHPRGVGRLSGDMGNGIGDLGYISRILEHMPGLESFLCPIVYSTFDGGEFSFFGYIADRGAVRDYYQAPLRICPESILIHPPPIPEIVEPEPEPEPVFEPEIVEDEPEPEQKTSTDDLHDTILQDVKEQLDDGRLRYEEPPEAILKPIKRPVLKPEDDPSVA